MIQAHEIQGVLALENAFNRVGLDHVLLVKVAVDRRRHAAARRRQSRSSPCRTLGRRRSAHLPPPPNTGPRKTWAAGDAPAVPSRLALDASGGPGLPSALSAPKWGFSDVLFRGNPFRRAALWLLRDGERAVQDRLPGRVPRADRRRMRVEAAPAGQVQRRSTRSRDQHRDPGSRRAHHRQDRPARQPRRPRPLPAVHGRRRR